MIITLPAPPLPASSRQGPRLLVLAGGVLALHAAALLQGPWPWPNSSHDAAPAWVAAQNSHVVTLLPTVQQAPDRHSTAPRDPPPPAQPPRAVKPAHAAKPMEQVMAAAASPPRAQPPLQEVPDPPSGALPPADTLTETTRSAAPQPAPRLPRPLTLDYMASRGSAQGEAVLDWAPSPDGSYQLSLRLALVGRPTSGWVSSGHTGADGLAPDRMVEERRQRPVKAINFQRDKGLISFSSATTTVPLQPGGQDRISWLVQLCGLAQALDDKLNQGTELSLQVATVAGLAERWFFRVASAETLRLEGQPEQAAWRLVREPQRPYDQRVEVWLARGNGLLPLQLRLTPVPTGEPLLLWLRHPLGEVAGA